MDSSSQFSFPAAATSTATAKVVAETVECRHGSFSATLHSGVKITNTTPVELEIAMQTPMGAAALGEPLVLGLLRSGAASWLPVAKAEVGMLCIRPAASYRPQRFSKRLPMTSSASSGVVYRSGRQQQQQQTSSSMQGFVSASDLLVTSSHHGGAFEWSDGVALTQLLRQHHHHHHNVEGSVHGGGGGVSSSTMNSFKQISCAAAGGESSAPLLLSIGTSHQGKCMTILQ